MNTTVKLASCNKKKVCDRCDIVYILVHYVTPLMQCLTNDIKDWNMQLITTKCLNTAVMLMYFLMGPKGISHAEYCDSRRMQEEHKKGAMKNKDMLSKMKRIMLNPRVRQRYIYYILINDATFPHPTKGTVFFPGHVFLVERTVDDMHNSSFNVYQSYINEYDLKEYMTARKNTFRYTFSQMQRLLAKIRYIINAETWDDLCVKYWKDFTHVNTSDLVGAQHKGNLFICFSHDKLKSCVANIAKYTESKLQELRSMPKNEVYGNKQLYSNHRGITPLTNGEIEQNLKLIANSISENKKNL